MKNDVLNPKINSGYVKVSSYEARIGEVDTCVLLYSGGLDTSVMLKWLQETYRCKVATLTVNIGQPTDDMEAIKRKALALGACEAHVMDCKEEFARDYLTKAIKANACYQGDYHLSTPLGRPLLAAKAVELCQRIGGNAIAHGCTGKGNDQVRIEAAALCIDPSIKVLAPVREWGMGRSEEIAYAKEHGIEVKQRTDLPYSWDENMWGITGEGGEIEDVAETPRVERILQMSKTKEQAPDYTQKVVLRFERGIPVAVDGREMGLPALIAELNAIGAEHAIGTAIVVEDRLVGIKVRGVYENPGAHIIITAHRMLERLVSTREANEFKELVDSKWAYLCYGGKWMDPLMSHLNAFIEDQNQRVSGEVTVSLYKGSIDVVAMTSPFSMMDSAMATFERSSAFNQNAAPGFIELYSLPMRTFARRGAENTSR